MSRSDRKTPIYGMTTAASDKVCTKAEHRRARRQLKTIDLQRNDPPAPKVYGNSWPSEKDGKQWFDAVRCPDLVRK
ncbi:hypothetical protein [Roseovarius sp. EL26]|uniref:hypothetical protein n=1 Tax=Roseovarius sp. EL26 TaxID=2126672 RepID=UPI000EA13283|nr:hypothetical protein [Roseovarius sp. EL26]